MYLSETDHAFLAVQVSRYQSDVASVLVMIILVLHHVLGWKNILSDAVKLTLAMGYFSSPCSKLFLKILQRS